MTLPTIREQPDPLEQARTDHQGVIRLTKRLVRIPSRAGIDPYELATGRGEDYELLVSLPPERLAEASEATATADIALTTIGAVLEGAGVLLRERDGAEREASGFDQLGG